MTRSRPDPPDELTALRESEEQHRLLFQANPNPMWLYDPANLRFLDVNSEAVRQYGYTRDEFLRMTLRDIRPEDANEELDRALSDAASAGGNTHAVRHRAKDGRTIHVMVTGSTVRYHGKPVRLVTAVDFTDRVQAEQAQRESEERFRQLAESIREAFWLVEVDGGSPTGTRLLYVSPSYEEIWKRSRESLLADPQGAMVAIAAEDVEKVNAAFARTVAGGSAEVEYQISWPDGTRRWLLTREFPVRNSDGQVYRVAGVTEDITDRKGLEERLLRSQRLEAVGQLTSGIAHDFNNLLMVIQGNAQLVESALPDDVSLRADTREIIQAARRAESLIRHLLAFSRKQVMQLKTIDLNELIGEVKSIFSRVLRADILMETELADSLPAIEADPGQMHQVLMNLVVNARDAMPSGGKLTLRSQFAEITEEVANSFPYEVKPGSYVKLSVTDTGVGMSKEVKRRLFEPFFTTKPHGEGTGLGLSTVYGIIKQSGGYVWVRSVEGKGTTFDVYLPTADDRVPSDSSAQPTFASGGTKTVLVVEDDRSLRTLFRRVLERGGHTAMEAANGEEALEVMERSGEDVDVVITDVIMPAMGGQELGEKLRVLYPDLEMVFVSGYFETEAACRESLGERVHFLHKPITSDNLLAKLNEIS